MFPTYIPPINVESDDAVFYEYVPFCCTTEDHAHDLKNKKVMRELY